MSFDPNEPDLENESETVKKLRKELKRRDEKLKEAEEAIAWRAQYEERETFAKAGVPVDDPRFPYFKAGYPGDKTPEAIKAEWDRTFGATHNGTGQQEQIDAELGWLTAAQDMTTAAPNISPDKLAERDQKLQELSPTDPRYTEKFDAIFAAYGGKRGGLVG